MTGGRLARGVAWLGGAPPPCGRLGQTTLAVPAPGALRLAHLAQRSGDKQERGALDLRMAGTLAKSPRRLCLA